MTDARAAADEQAAIWNGAAGRGWAALQDVLDSAFRPFEEHLAAAAVAAGAESALDVGCGAGAVTQAVARATGGACVGVDISGPLIAAARARAGAAGAAARFILADAGTHAFEPEAFDIIVSRFGVMFFADPVRAFANLRAAAREKGALCVIAWRSAKENPFMTAAERAAAPLLPALPPREPDAPGQFAFADRERVARILKESGWRAVRIAPLDMPCVFPEAALVPYFTTLGPVGRVLQETDEAARPALREKIVAAVRPAFEPFVQDGEVRFDAACWRIEAAA
ncbi:MAG: class I SAM-dependent methyltransferase [Pseudomonadota bacterium]|nr:class I SAM-dependent methyltransferase [Pseudomonadota bacterium]